MRTVRALFDLWHESLSMLLLASVVSVVSVVHAFPPAPAAQSVEEAHAKSIGCLSCHTASDRATMHQNPAVILGCTDCHGGNAKVQAQGVRRHAAEYVELMRTAHVLPRDEKAWHWPSIATPEITYTLLNR